MNEILSVAQRMNNAGPTKGTGITKSSVKQGLLNIKNQQGQARSQQKANPIPYQVPGQPAQPLAAPQQGQAQNAILRPGDNYNPYYYKPVKPDFSSINPNDPDEIEYQRKEKQRNDIWAKGGAATLQEFGTKARNDIMEKTREINRLGQEKMTAARKADPRFNDAVIRNAIINY